MHICFVDESTTPPKPTKRAPKPYFVMAGVFLPVSQWHGVADDIAKLKKLPAFRVRGEIKWRFFGSHNDDKTNSVRHLDSAARDEFRKAFFGILKARKSIKAVIAATSVSEAYKRAYINDEHDLYLYTYKIITERFQYHLQDIGREIGTKQCGLIVADHRGRDDDERVRRQHQKLIHSTSGNISKYDNLIESVLLAPSHNSVGIQCADMLAGAASRSFNADDDRWMSEIQPILRSRNGTINGAGLALFPVARPSGRSG